MKAAVEAWNEVKRLWYMRDRKNVARFYEAKPIVETENTAGRLKKSIGYPFLASLTDC
jgi:hypothetical protein